MLFTVKILTKIACASALAKRVINVIQRFTE